MLTNLELWEENLTIQLEECMLDIFSNFFWIRQFNSWFFLTHFFKSHGHLLHCFLPYFLILLSTIYIFQTRPPIKLRLVQADWIMSIIPVCMRICYISQNKLRFLINNSPGVSGSCICGNVKVKSRSCRRQELKNNSEKNLRLSPAAPEFMEQHNGLLSEICKAICAQISQKLKDQQTGHLL